MGTHKTLVNGTAFAVTAGTELINGTICKKGGGRTLVNGTAFEVKFGSSEYVITLTGSGGTVIYNGVAQTGTFTVKAGESVEIKAIGWSSVAYAIAKITLNGKEVAAEQGASAEAVYTYTPTSNATINVTVNSRAGRWYMETIDITEE